MRNTTKTLVLVLILLFSATLVQGIGLSPPQLRIENVVLGVNSTVATLVVTNTENEPVFLIMKVSSLSHSRPHKLRVICMACNRHVGIQRGDLIYPAKIIQLMEQEIYTNTAMGINQMLGQNATVEYKAGGSEDTFIPFVTNYSYAVGEYVLIKDGQYTLSVPGTNISIIRDGSYVFKKIDKDEAVLNNKYCPFCGASEEHMIFYDFPPKEVMDNVTLSCDEHPLFPFRDGFMSNVTIPVDESAEVKIGVYVADIKKHYGKHWELRIMATTVSNISLLDSFIVYGAETKFLVDTPEWIPKQIEKQDFDSTVLILPVGGIIAVACIVIGYVKRPVKSKKEKRKKVVSLEERKSKPKKIKMYGGRKIL